MGLRLVPLSGALCLNTAPEEGHGSDRNISASSRHGNTSDEDSPRVVTLKRWGEVAVGGVAKTNDGHNKGWRGGQVDEQGNAFKRAALRRWGGGVSRSSLGTCKSKQHWQCNAMTAQRNAQSNAHNVSSWRPLFRIAKMPEVSEMPSDTSAMSFLCNLSSLDLLMALSLSHFYKNWPLQGDLDMSHMTLKLTYTFVIPFCISAVVTLSQTCLHIYAFIWKLLMQQVVTFKWPWYVLCETWKLGSYLCICHPIFTYQLPVNSM